MVIRKSLISILAVAAIALACSEEETVTPVSSHSEDKPVRVPEDFKTIQEAVDAVSDGDTIYVAPGTYSGEGNRDINFGNKVVYLIAEAGPSETVIDCADTLGALHRAFLFANSAIGSEIDGFRITGGRINIGAAISCVSSGVVVRNCVFDNNVATTSGGAIRGKSSKIMIINCSFVGNSATAGGAMFFIATSEVDIRNCLIASSGAGGSIFVSDASTEVDISCTNIYGNGGGDWNEDIADQANINGNFAADPLFCGGAVSPFSLQTGSPCLPENNSCGELIGALGECPDYLQN